MRFWQGDAFALSASSCYDRVVPASTVNVKTKSEPEILADATDRMLRAIKEKMLREKGKLDYEALAQEGYSPEMIARLKEL
jgi:hypothetical protein